MSGKLSHPITTRSGASVPNVGDPTSTSSASHSSNLRPDGSFVMPQTPEQLEELFRDVWLQLHQQHSPH